MLVDGLFDFEIEPVAFGEKADSSVPIHLGNDARLFTIALVIVVNPETLLSQ